MIMRLVKQSSHPSDQTRLPQKPECTRLGIFTLSDKALYPAYVLTVNVVGELCTLVRLHQMGFCRNCTVTLQLGLLRWLGIVCSLPSAVYASP